MAIAKTDGSPKTVDAAWVERYLALLGLEREAPSLDALARLTRAHLLNVPFVNVTAILRRHAHPGDGPVPPLDLDEMLRTWERREGGGVCFDVAEMFCPLLVSLGYEARLAAATIGQSNHGAHLGIRVDLDGATYLVDAGNGAPFFDPIPSDRTTELHVAGLAWRFRPHDDLPDWIVQDRWIDEQWEPFCNYDLGPADPAVVADAYQRHHRLGVAWVCSSLVMVHSQPDVVHALRDKQLSRFTTDGKDVSQLTTDAEFERLATEVYGLPSLPVTAARRALEEANKPLSRILPGPDNVPRPQDQAGQRADIR
jgi:N-hydroxyarylamine O-acetyltransferase